MKSEIAVTRRAAYAAEEAMQKLEKAKQHQDYLIDDMQVGTVFKSRRLVAWSSQKVPAQPCQWPQFGGWSSLCRMNESYISSVSLSSRTADTKLATPICALSLHDKSTGT
jgi:hypothetical protein